MSWFLRYAAHLGYRPPFEPLFAASGGADRLSQIDFAADHGFSRRVVRGSAELDVARAGERRRSAGAPRSRGGRHAVLHLRQAAVGGLE